MSSNLSLSWIPAAILMSSVLMLEPSPAGAQTVPEPGTWTVTPFLHGSIGIGDPAPGNSMGLGVGVTYDWTSRLAVEGEIGHLFDVAGDDANVDWSVSTFSANAIYRFDTRYVTPYVTLGLGLERSSYDSEPADPALPPAAPDVSATEVALNFGGGMTYAINDRWRARADLRRFQANDIAPDFWRLYAGLTWKIR